MRRRDFLGVLGAAAPLAAQRASFPALLLKGGRLIDPRNSLDAVLDLAISGGRVTRVGANLAPDAGSKVIDCAGLIVTPGLVDIHVHAFHTTGVPQAWAGDHSIAPDSISFRTGVTTMVDAGSSGYRNFEQFRATVIDRTQTRLLAMLNVAGYGMMTNVVEQNTTDMLPDKIAALARKHKDVVVGVKSAHYEKPDWTSVDRAIEAGKLARIPVMVDFGFFLAARPYWQLVTERLRPGDISTHMFRGPAPYVDEAGKLLPYLRQARSRGVKFDVGHGGGSFVMRNAAPAIAQGFYPDSISTDLHVTSMNAGLMDMPTTMSKLMALGLPLQEAILRSTSNPAQMIQRPELGHLSVGALADVAVWSVQKGEFGFRDSNDGKVTGRERLQCEMTLKDGVVAWDWNSRSGVDYRTLPKNYGVRPAEVITMPPK
ncbi:MAG TPA: amidohydrolase/deacetylase family metallohydrolase [Bryobacteraceae bacterium]|nr:amidohydrolase/deacetylase family metallohydrolase [Bryobacteraceae bacterium]